LCTAIANFTSPEKLEQGEEEREKSLKQDYNEINSSGNKPGFDIRKQSQRA
jgi:hypothetical protein